MGAETVVNDYEAVIAAGQSVSGAVDLGPRHLFAIQTPAVLEAGTLCLSFLGSVDGINFFPIYDELGAEKFTTVVINAAQYILVDPVPWLGIRWFKLRAGTLVASVAQAADRTFALVAVR